MGHFSLRERVVFFLDSIFTILSPPFLVVLGGGGGGAKFTCFLVFFPNNFEPKDLILSDTPLLQILHARRYKYVVLYIFLHQDRFFFEFGLPHHFIYRIALNHNRGSPKEGTKHLLYHYGEVAVS